MIEKVCGIFRTPFYIDRKGMRKFCTPFSLKDNLCGKIRTPFYIDRKGMRNIRLPFILIEKVCVNFRTPFYIDRKGMRKLPHTFLYWETRNAETFAHLFHWKTRYAEIFAHLFILIEKVCGNFRTPFYNDRKGMRNFPHTFLYW